MSVHAVVPKATTHSLPEAGSKKKEQPMPSPTSQGDLGRLDRKQSNEAAYSKFLETSAAQQFKLQMEICMALMRNPDPESTTGTEKIGEMISSAIQGAQQVKNNELMRENIDTLHQGQKIQSGFLRGIEVAHSIPAFNHSQGESQVLLYHLPHDALSANAHIVNENGKTIRSISLKELRQGEHEFAWDGLDNDGNEAPEGNYRVAVEAVNAKGETLTAEVMVVGTIDEILWDGQSAQFKVKDEAVTFDQIKKVLSTKHPMQTMTAPVSSNEAVRQDSLQNLLRVSPNPYQGKPMIKPTLDIVS